MFWIRFSSLTADGIFRLASEKLKADMLPWEKAIWKFITEWMDTDVDYVEVHTSGSTGDAKEMKHQKEAMLRSAAATCKALELHEGNKALLCLPADKISGMMMLVRCLYNKMDLFCIKPSTNPLNEMGENDKFDFAAFTPMQLFDVMNSQDKLNRAENIEKIILGGEAVSPALLNTVKSLKNEVYATFGMTETISHIALRRLNGVNSANYFTTLDGVTVSTDERSCTVIHAPHLNVYGLVTNDVVNLISAIEFEWIGRADNVINSGGVKLFPEKTEREISSFIEMPFFIGWVEDQRVGQRVVLVIEADSIAEKKVEELKAHLAQLPAIERPKELFLCAQFVRTSNGKLMRKESLHRSRGSINL